MNKTYTSKWNAALGAWVACSEITRRAGKQTVVGAVLVGAVFGASAQNCPQAADGSYMAGDGPQPSAGCTVIPATSGQLVQSPTAGFYVLTRSNLRGPLTVGNANVKAYVNGGYGGIGNQYALGPAASIQTGNLTFDTSTTDNTTSIGSHSGVNITTADANIKAVMTYGGGNSTGGAAIYGILAGSAVISGEGGTGNTALNGTFTTVTLDNLTLNQNSSGGKVLPILNSGLRAIQGANQDAGNGSSGKIEVKGTLNMTMTGSRIEGIYVSGSASGAGGEAVSQAVLNDSNITLVQSGAVADSSAIKIGKTRAIGSGKGLVVSSGALKIDMGATLGGSQPYMSPAIKMAVSGSQLLANGANSSAEINASRSALAIGIDDWGSNTDSTNIQALFAKATVKTQSTTAPLVLVDSGQQGVQILFDRASNLTAASNGYLIDIIKYRAATTASSVQFTLDNKSIATGLTNKAYATSTLDIDLNNASTWNLVEKSNGDKTASYTSVDMKAASTLNAFKPGAAAFVMNGPVTSDASTTNLVDGAPDDVLTMRPSYSGSNGAALAVDTCLAGSGAASDRLVVNGDTSGTTVLKVTPFADPACPGADTTTTGDGKGILVVQVTGNSNAVFTLDGGTVTQGSYAYKLAKVGNDWYLQSQAATGTVTVTKRVDAPADAPAFSGNIPFTLNCTTPNFNQTGMIAVTGNLGSAAPITVASGSICSVTEGALPASPGGYHWGAATLPPAGAPMPSGGAQSLAIVNTLLKDGIKTGQLQVTKTVQVDADAPAYSGSIDFSVSCTNPVFNTNGSLAVSANQGIAAPITVQAGSACTVTETLPTAPTGMEWATPAYVQPGTIAEGQTTTATITNKLNKKDPGTVAAVPVDSPLALGGLAALIGLAAFRRQRSERRTGK